MAHATLYKKQRCQVCGEEPDIIYDAKTKNGQWAFMCKTCWKMIGAYSSLGVGLGQKFVNEDGGVKLEG